MFEKIQNTSNSIVIGTILLLFLTLFIILNLLLYYYKRKKHYAESESLKTEFRQTLLQTQLEIQEQTLKNISQEIHDNIGQALSLAKLNLNTMSIENAEQLQQKITNSKELVSKAIVDLRDLSRSLDTDYVQEMGLLRAIEYELELICKTGTMETQLQVEGAASRSDKQKELILFRIVQETFNNIIKHAEAKNIKVNVNYNPSELIILVTDDGKGVDLNPLNEQNNSRFGLGIRNMHNRAKLIGADFSMHSSLGKGTEIKIILPKQKIIDESKQ
jgi:two-component system, NarL family, sensor kinase